MRYAALALLLACTIMPLSGQDQTQGPADEKARKTYQEGLGFLKQRNTLAALDCFKKADKQDGGHCQACQEKMIKYGIELGEWKIAEEAGAEKLPQSQGKELALAHHQLGIIFLDEALTKHKDEVFQHAHDEMSKALDVYPNFPDAVYTDGRILAYLNKDEEAKARFEQYSKMKPEGDPNRQRALIYVEHPELARARMAPPFAVTTLDGQHISLDELKGKVVLLDFWATWCGPCREALPHMKAIAKNFAGQPLVILSVSVDTNEDKWKEFVEKNGMAWAQYRDDGFDGPIARMFKLNAIPHTFTIDADGVLQDERTGDASIEGKLKKLVARARDMQSKELQSKEMPAPEKQNQ